MSRDGYKTGHPVLGIVLGILGIVIALLLILLTGVIGGGVACLLGLAAVLIGVFAVKGGRRGGGIASTVIGVLAIVLAVTLTFSAFAVFNEAKKEAQGNPNTPLLARYLDKPGLGFLGILTSIPDGEATDETFDALQAELDILKGKAEAPAEATTEEAPSGTAAEEAPAA